MKSTSEALRIDSPGWYKIGVRTQGSVNKLHSVYTDADFLAVIMDAAVVIAVLHRPAVKVSEYVSKRVLIKSYTKCPSYFKLNITCQSNKWPFVSYE